MKKNFEIEELVNINKNLSGLVESKDFVTQEINKFLNGSSKKIRSIISILYLKSLGKEVHNSVISILTAGELIHNASLLHDDILDNSDVRRGELTIGATFTPEISILSGDYLLSFATEKLLEIKNWDVIKNFKNCTKKMCEAEFKQYLLRGKIPTIEEYLEIAEGKTAFLFKTILECCAIVSDINKENAGIFGKNFGILFQLKNDLEITSAQNDLKNKVQTPKDFLGIEKTSVLIDNYLEELRVIIQNLPENIYKKSLEDLLEEL